MLPLPPQFSIYTTADGSPTLATRREDGYVEKMHHSGGALSESMYIYHAALLDGLERGWAPKVLSLGLGLGYNELLSLAEFVKRGYREWEIFSFELDSSLRAGFAAWAEGQRTSSELARIMSEVAHLCARAVGCNAGDLRTEAASALTDGRLKLYGAFPAEAPLRAECTVVYYDAFSRKMHPELWEETLLETHLNPLLSTGCVLATYAATGNLNRSLKRLGFRLIDKPGFQGKRESTLAIRELGRYPLM